MTAPWNEPLLAMWTVTPDVAVGVDRSCCIVLVTTEGKGPRHDVPSGYALIDAINRARDYVTIREAVMTDWKDDPVQGEAVAANYARSRGATS